MGLASLTVAGQGHIGEGFFVSQMLEGGDHVGLEVIPSETKLLLIALSHGEELWVQFSLNLK